MTEEVLVKGSVKWYNKEKGYGFINVAGSLDVFVHANQLNKSGIVDGLREGEKVTFSVENGPKGNFATNIKRLMSRAV